MNSGVLSPQGPGGASFSACVSERERAPESGARVWLLSFFCSNEPVAPWEAKCLLLLVISMLAAGGFISRAYLSQAH